MVLVGGRVFVEAYRTIQGHPDGASGPFNPLGASPFVVLGIATAGVGLWVLLTGRRLRDWRHDRILGQLSPKPKRTVIRVMRVSNLTTSSRAETSGE